jgi:hypothetical protein
MCYRAIEILIKNNEKQVLITAEVYYLIALEAESLMSLDVMGSWIGR